MKKINRKIFLLIAFIIILDYYSKDYEYEPSYEIIKEDAFASYSNGLVYIGSEKYLETIKYSENDVLICDNRHNLENPDMIIYNSYRIKNKEQINEILNIICDYEKCYPSKWNRTIESMRLEWYIHNVSYYCNYSISRSINVDLDNNEAEKYKNKVLNKILKI